MKRILSLLVLTATFALGQTNDLPSELKRIEDAISRQDQAIQKAKDEKQQVALALQGAQSEIAKLQTEIKQLQANKGKLESLQAENARLQAEKSKITALQTETTRLREENTKLQTQASKALESSARNQDLLSQVPTLQAEKQILVKENAELHRTIEAKQAEFATMVTKFQEENKQFLAAFSVIRAKLEKQTSP